MKKSLLILSLVAAIAMPASAKWDGDGYYRIKNYMTERYLYVLDNEADINYTATTVDMNGVELWRGEERAIADPSTVVYIKKVGNQYDILAQGTGIHEMSDVYLNLRYDEGKDAYYAYGSSNGMTKYLGDSNTSSKDRAFLKDNASGDYRLWKIIPISATSDNYLGLDANVEINGADYTSIYVNFPFSTASEGVEMFYISQIDEKHAAAVMKPVPGNIVPADTPVLIKLSGASATDNRLDVGTKGAKAISDNILSGVFFDNEGDAGHYKLTEYDPKTMRVLGISKEDKLAMVADEDLEILPRNKAYLKVNASCPEELIIMTEAEYDELVNGVNDIIADADKTFDVYNVLGVKVLSGVNKVENLPAGIYVANGRKFIVR